MKQLGEAINYIKESKRYIYFIIFVFFLFSFIGFFFADKFTYLDTILAEILLRVEGLDWFEMVFFILQNNLLAVFLGLLGGVVFGIFPVSNAIGNGVVLGYVANKVMAASSVFELWRIFPHGIFELAAVFIALGLGVKFGMFIFAEDKIKELNRRFYESINVLLVVILPLLVLAAIIEGILIALI